MDSESAIVLIAMHPQYVDLISQKIKRIEFRRKPFSKPVKTIVIYSTSPIKKIVGFFDVKKIESSTPNIFWEKYSSIGGISQTDFFHYFHNTSKAIGIHIKKYTPLLCPINLSSLGLTVPQSYLYLTENQFDIIKRDIRCC